MGLLSSTNLVNTQAGSINGLAGKGGASLNNTTTSLVTASGEANAQTGNIPSGATVGSAAASALGGSTKNTVLDQSNVSVTVGGANEAPITVVNENTRNIRDVASASTTSGAATGAQPAVTAASASPVTASNAVPPVTPTAVTAAVASASPSPAVAAPSATPSSVTQAATSPASPVIPVAPTSVQAPACTGQAATTTITGSAEKKVTEPAPSGQPIDIGLSQRANTTNTGSTTGVLAAAAPVLLPTGSLKNAVGGGATATGLSATNTVQNTALVDVTIGGSNFAPINIAVRTVTTIVNAAKSVVETAAGVGDATGAVTGVGTRAANKVSLDGTAAVEIAGDNHNPIRIVLDIGAELWNKGMALLGLGQGNTAPVNASATGLEVENLVKLLGRASVKIGGSNYAPIDIDILLQNIIYNDGLANAGSAGLAAASDAVARAGDLSSGPATCASLLTTAGVVNGQVANIKLAEDALRRKVLGGNTHVVDVQGYGTARCTTGDATGSGGTSASGDVNVLGGGTTLTVVTAQVTDTSAKTEAKPQDRAAGATGQTAQVVVSVTSTPVKVPGKTAGGGRDIQSPITEEEETWQWQWVVVWEPLYVIYPQDEEPEFQGYSSGQAVETVNTETTTSMAGSFRRPDAITSPATYAASGLDLISQIQLAALGLLAFLLLALLKRRLRAEALRKAEVRTPELVLLQGGVETAAE